MSKRTQARILGAAVLRLIAEYEPVRLRFLRESFPSVPESRLRYAINWLHKKKYIEAVLDNGIIKWRIINGQSTEP